MENKTTSMEKNNLVQLITYTFLLKSQLKDHIISYIYISNVYQFQIIIYFSIILLKNKNKTFIKIC